MLRLKFLNFQKLHRRGIDSLPEPCCSPDQLDPIKILYVEQLHPDGDLTVREGTVEGVVVRSCRCG